MKKMREESSPRVPFGHPGLEIRHPLRGLGVQVIDGKSVLSIAIYSRPPFWDTTLKAPFPFFFDFPSRSGYNGSIHRQAA
jgi:hypothetical protein